MIKTILVPVDGSTHANAAVDWASDLATKYRARIIILNVITEGPMAAFPDELRELARTEKIEVTGWELVESLAQRVVETAEQRARSRGATMVEAVVEAGNPAKAILAQVARTGAELIVMGRRGRGGLPGLVLGSVSSKVLQLAECACLTVK